MKTVGAYDAKTHLPALLEEVARGERIQITRRGVPIALIVPIETEANPDVQSVIDELLQRRQKHPLRGVSVRELIDEGRRF